MGEIITYSFCDNYIKKLADYIDNNYIKKGKDLRKIAIVFGGKRPSLFLKSELAERIRTSFYSPQFFTIDEFINYTAGKKEVLTYQNKLDNYFVLYKLAKEFTPEIVETRRSFARFLPWSSEILSFIEQLDLEDISPEALENVKANATIGYTVPENINKLLKNIIVLRNEYHKTHKKNKTTTRGLNYLLAAEAVKEVNFSEFEHVLFCNFFYFHKTEEIVVKELFEKGKATLIFQGDERKWSVLKRITKSFKCSLQEGDAPDTPRFNLKLYSGFDVHSEVCLVREILKQIKNPDKTVIVVPDPKNIVSLLSEIPSIVCDFNVSLGYPLSRSSLNLFLSFVTGAQTSKKKNKYYTRDYLKLIKHPFVSNMTPGEDAKLTKVIIEVIESILTGRFASPISGSIFINLEEIEESDELFLAIKETMIRNKNEVNRKEIKEIIKSIHQIYFNNFEDVKTFEQFAGALNILLDNLIKQSSVGGYPLNVNIAGHLLSIVDEFKKVSFKSEHFKSDEIFKIFENKIEGEIIPFTGSPLKGMQILGLLETRSLSFENVIILDANEGVLPKLSVYEPLIPREVMISLSLERLEMEEEIQRYQFMRLISSAKNVHLVYQESKEAERSRFVEELIWEKEKIAGDLNVVDIARASFNIKFSAQTKSVEKTKEMIAFLKNFTFSASSINTYVENPLEFYYRYVLGLEEEEDLLDEPEAKDLGIFIHEFLKDAYKPLLKKDLRIDRKFKDRFFKLLDDRFEERFGRSMKGDAFLLKAVVEERMTRFLLNEESNEERQAKKILYLEDHFENVIPLTCGNIKFRYIVDRVDVMKDGSIVIIDYKTGGRALMPKQISELKSLELSRGTIKENIRSFQIPLYFHYFSGHFKDRPINAALYNIRTLKFDKFITERKNYTIDEINYTFLKALDFIVSEILDPTIHFIENK